MRRNGTILAVALVWAITLGGAVSFAGEQADWGRVVGVGDADDNPILLIENEGGIHVVIVDPDGEMRTNTRDHAALWTIKEGDYVDLSVSTWAGMQIVDLVVVTPNPESRLAKAR